MIKSRRPTGLHYENSQSCKSHINRSLCIGKDSAEVDVITPTLAAVQSFLTSCIYHALGNRHIALPSLFANTA